MIVSGIAEYIRNKEGFKNNTFVYKHTGVSYYLVNGKKTCYEELKKKYPLQLRKSNYKGEDVDTTKIK